MESKSNLVMGECLGMVIYWFSLKHFPTCNRNIWHCLWCLVNNAFLSLGVASPGILGLASGNATVLFWLPSSDCQTGYRPTGRTSSPPNHAVALCSIYRIAALSAYEEVMG